MLKPLLPAPRLQAAFVRWGFPRLRSNGPLLGAAAIDSTGSGLFFAFHVVYFIETTSLSLTQVGAALTLAQLLALPSPVVIGALVDRFGPRRIAVLGNLICAGGFLGFLGAHEVWQVVLSALVVQVGVNFYWTCSGALIALAAGSEDRVRWFAFIQALRNAGVAVGGALAALAIGAGGEGWLRSLVVANAMSYVAAATLTSVWKPTAVLSGSEEFGVAPSAGGAEDLPVKGSYGVVLRDAAYLRLVVVNLVFVLAALVLNVLLAAYIIKGLQGSAWWAGALLTVNAVAVAVFQSPTTRSTEHRDATRVLAGAAMLNAAAFAAFGLLNAAPHSMVVPGLVAALIVYTAAEMLQSPTISSLSTFMAPDRMRGRYLAVYQSSWNAGGVLAPILFTYLLALGPAWPWLLLVIVNLAAVVLLGDLERRYKHRFPVRSPRAAELVREDPAITSPLSGSAAIFATTNFCTTEKEDVL